MSRRSLLARSIVKQSYRTVFMKGWGGRIVWWVVSLWFIAEASAFIITSMFPSNVGIPALFLFNLLIFGILYSVLAVRWHRFTWMQENFGSLRSMVPTKRDWLFFGFSIVLLIVTLLPFAIGTGVGIASFYATPALGVIVMFFAYIGSFWIVLRMILALPIIALDSEHKVLDSWKMTKGHAWKIFLIVMMTFAPFTVASFILAKISIFFAESNVLLVLILNVAVSWFNVIGFGVAASAATLIFKEVREPRLAV